MKKLDMLENDFLPQVASHYSFIETLIATAYYQVMVDKTEVVFGDIKFIEAVSKTISIANTGQVRVLPLF